MMRGFAGSIVVLVAVAAGCGKQSASCVPGEQQACGCSAGGSGTQTCVADGSKFTDCQGCAAGQDMAATAADLATASDMSRSVDMTRTLDLQPPPDLWIPIGCADGTVELGEAAWKRRDIAFCKTATLPAQVDAAAACGAGWHVCTSAEFTARNDQVQTQLQLGATLAGSECIATNLAAGAVQHQLNADTVRPDAPGGCVGNQGTPWGRQTGTGYYGQAPFQNQGVLCCW